MTQTVCVTNKEALGRYRPRNRNERSARQPPYHYRFLSVERRSAYRRNAWCCRELMRETHEMDVMTWFFSCQGLLP